MTISMLEHQDQEVNRYGCKFLEQVYDIGFNASIHPTCSWADKNFLSTYLQWKWKNYEHI